MRAQSITPTDWNRPEPRPAYDYLHYIPPQVAVSRAQELRTRLRREADERIKRLKEEGRMIRHTPAAHTDTRSLSDVPTHEVIARGCSVLGIDPACLSCHGQTLLKMRIRNNALPTVTNALQARELIVALARAKPALVRAPGNKSPWTSYPTIAVMLFGARKRGGATSHSCVIDHVVRLRNRPDMPQLVRDFARLVGYRDAESNMLAMLSESGST